MPIFRKEQREFDMLKVGLASPERILSWSHGEVEKPETINYRTFKPERKGLFDEKIFGPVKDWECHCGKYRRVRYRGIVCERCGVEVTTSRVRRERMAHIKLTVPVAHVWFLRGIPSYIGVLLDLTTKALEEVIYYDSYIVLEVDEDLKGKIRVGNILREPEFQEARQKHGNKFKADMGAKAIRDLLSKIDLSSMVTKLRRELKGSTGQRRIKVIKQLRVAESFLKSNNRPEWMIQEVLPVMPPDLRPMVQLEGGRFATSDLNDLYRRVINRNNRLKKMIAMGAPDMIVRNEKRMLQEAVDVLIDNSRRKRPVLGSTGRPLKSLSDIIEGKQGRFRQNLLGKRADYSGRSVIVVGPNLKMHQCGLPKEMALELFKPFVIRQLVARGLAQNVKSGKRMIERREVLVWDILEDVIQGHPVFLNRAPTLHRLGIQAFEPVLVEGKAIQIHPLVCPAFNADFDGDQMAVHVPLTIEAQVEARVLMLSTNNVLSPASGRPVITPTQDMVLGSYYLTVMDERDEKGRGLRFANSIEAVTAHESREIALHAPITVRIGGEMIETTAGRVIFNDTLNDIFRAKLPTDQGLGFINEVVDKKRLERIIRECYDRFGSSITCEIADEIKRMGFTYATLGGISIGLDDLIIPSNKKKVVQKAEQEIAEMEQLVKEGTLSAREQFMNALDIWSNVTETITNKLVEEFDKLNPVYMMAFSGARGNLQQVRQLSGIRGLMADPSGNIISIPIKTNFKEGLDVTEYFISSYGARKGLVDTALRTADSGYLTRRLVDVCQDVIVVEADCNTDESIELGSVREGFEEIVPLLQRALGRFAFKNIVDPITNKVIVKAGKEISPEDAKNISDAGVEKITVRSVLTCKVKRGVCQMCHGRDLSTGGVVNLGEAVGIIAAQSIGEPGTQLTMRTFHTGGVALHKGARVQIRTKHGGKVQYGTGIELRNIPDDQGKRIQMVVRESRVYVKIRDKKEEYILPVGSVLRVKDEGSIEAGGLLAEFDPTYEYAISASAGKVYFTGIQIVHRKRKAESGTVVENLAKGDGEIFIYSPKGAKEYNVPKGVRVFVRGGEKIKAGTELAAGVVSKITGIVLEVNEKRGQSVTIAPGESYSIVGGSVLFVEDGQAIEPYEILSKVESLRSDPSKTRDIIQGLPRVEELFEGRRPKDPVYLSDIDGSVRISERDGMRLVIVTGDKEEDMREYIIPYDIRLRVATGDKVTKGQALTYGTVSPHDVLRILGVRAVQAFLVGEIQKIYRGQGVTINDKHIELIVRQMTRRVRVLRPGDSTLLPGELVEKNAFDELVESTKGEKPQATEVLLGVTKASLSTESLISAASFQETARILTDAAIRGRTDEMYGLKENVIIGKLIPAGTGFSQYRHVDVVPAVKFMEDTGTAE